TLFQHRGFITHVLLRTDVLLCVEAGDDPGRSERAALWDKSERPSPGPVEEDLVQRRRDLQLLIGLCRDELPEVDLEPVADLLCDGFFDRRGRLLHGSRRGLDSAELTRLGMRSLRKLATASARLHL